MNDQDIRFDDFDSQRTPEEEYAEYWEDEPIDVDDDRNVNPYDGTYDNWDMGDPEQWFDDFGF